MHNSQSHQYKSGDPDQGTGNLPGSEQADMGGSGPNEHLLRNSGSDLCLSCHNEQTFAPDVLGANTGTHIRQAGGLTDTHILDAGGAALLALTTGIITALPQGSLPEERQSEPG